MDLTVVFDIGGVLIEWNPRHLYRTLFHDDVVAMEYFLTQVCTPEWNAELDRGRSFQSAVTELAQQHPEYRELIMAYHEQWPKMVPFAFEDTVEVLSEVKTAGYPLFALSNWSAETFPIMRQRYPFLDWFEDILLSGEVGIAKPDNQIYEVFLDRIKRTPDECLFIDDSERNIDAARSLGFQTLLFKSASQLRDDLATLNILPQKQTPE